jgi:hypothetical protein
MDAEPNDMDLYAVRAAIDRIARQPMDKGGVGTSVAEVVLAYRQAQMMLELVPEQLLQVITNKGRA